jgi:hypothetical protein
MIHVVRYEKNHQPLWDEFIAKSKNGVFLFYRNYMDYHADRFTDHSLLFFEDSRLIAVMPANIVGGRFISHGGLTFGGIISDSKMKMTIMLEIFEILREHLTSLGVKQLIYKAIPHIYHRLPAEEDLYALFVHKANLYRRDVSSTIPLFAKLRFSKGRKWCIKKGKTNGVQVRQSDDFETFIAIDEQHLMQKHGKKPVHTATEIQLLASLFPENIKLFAAYKGETMLGGTIMYESKQVAHAQYIAATDEGKEIGALDVILGFLINDYYQDKTYFDFGISTDHEGKYLDVGLVANKESFGARTTVYDFYEISLAS